MCVLQSWQKCALNTSTHIHLNLTRLPEYAAVRTEIDTFLEARQSRREASNTADTQRTQIVVWRLSDGERNEPSAFSQWNGGGACCAKCVSLLFLHGPSGQKEARGLRHG